MTKPDLFDPATMFHWMAGAASYGYMLHQLGHGGHFGWSHARIDAAKDQLLNEGSIKPGLAGDYKKTEAGYARYGVRS
jgi:hypothetical protein